MLSASDYQGNEKYPGVDNWSDAKLYEGNIVYCWEGDDNKTGNFFFTPEEVEACNGDPEKLADLAQVRVDDSYQSYRGHISAYRVTEDMDVEYSKCTANTCYGEGGANQYFINDENKANLERVEDLDIEFNKSNLDVSDEDMKAQTARVNDLNAEIENGITDRKSTEESEPYYKGSTPELEDQLKANKEEIQNKYDNFTPSDSKAEGENGQKPTENDGAESGKDSTGSAQNESGKKPELDEKAEKNVDNSVNGQTPSANDKEDIESKSKQGGNEISGQKPTEIENDNKENQNLNNNGKDNTQSGQKPSNNEEENKNNASNNKSDENIQSNSGNSAYDSGKTAEKSTVKDGNSNDNDYSLSY